MAIVSQSAFLQFCLIRAAVIDLVHYLKPQFSWTPATTLISAT
jgi:hypothetical protein